MSLIKKIGTALFCFFILSCSNTSKSISKGEFILDITVDDLADDTKVVLKKQENSATVTVDSTYVKNGKFEFRGSIESPAIFGIFIDSIQGGIFPLIEEGTIQIRAHKDSLYAPTITGSALNDELNSFKIGSQKIANKINDLFPQFQKARAENNVEEINGLNEKMRKINDENTQYSLDYAEKNPESFVSSMILQSLLRIPDIDRNKVAAIYNSFSDEVKQSDYAKSVNNFLKMSNLQVPLDSIN